MIIRKLLFFLALLAAGSGVAPSLSHAEPAWPSKPIRWIVPYSVGGGTDQTSRLIASRLSAAIGQPVIVENKPGGNTLIGAQLAANAPPDGYTVFFATQATLSVVPHMYAKLPYANDALVPVAQLVRFPLFLLVAADGPINTVARFNDAAKHEPLMYAIGGSGSGGHLGTALMAKQLNANMTAVPFKAMVQAAPEVAAGRIPFMFSDLPAALPLIQSGRARILATAGKARSSLYPNAPTLSEAGIADLSFETWAGLAVPKGTQQEIADRLSTELNKIMADPAVRKTLATAGVEPAPSTQARFTEFIAAENAKWAPVVREAGIKAE